MPNAQCQSRYLAASILQWTLKSRYLRRHNPACLRAAAVPRATKRKTALLLPRPKCASVGSVVHAFLFVEGEKCVSCNLSLDFLRWAPLEEAFAGTSVTLSSWWCIHQTLRTVPKVGALHYLLLLLRDRTAAVWTLSAYSWSSYTSSCSNVWSFSADDSLHLCEHLLLFQPWARAFVGLVLASHLFFN